MRENWQITGPFDRLHIPAALMNWRTWVLLSQKRRRRPLREMRCLIYPRNRMRMRRFEETNCEGLGINYLKSFTRVTVCVTFRASVFFARNCYGLPMLLCQPDHSTAEASLIIRHRAHRRVMKARRRRVFVKTLDLMSLTRWINLFRIKFAKTDMPLKFLSQSVFRWTIKHYNETSQQRVRSAV